MHIVAVWQRAEPVAQFCVAFKGQRVLALGAVQAQAGNAICHLAQEMPLARRSWPVLFAEFLCGSAGRTPVPASGPSSAPSRSFTHASCAAASFGKGGFARRRQPGQLRAPVAFDGDTQRQPFFGQPVDNAVTFPFETRRNSDKSLIRSPLG